MNLRTQLLAVIAICLLPLQAANAAPLPKGNYISECVNIKVDNGFLRAQCPKADGKYRNTMIHAESCGGGVSNVRGQLVCTAPMGTFSQTCKEIEIHDKKIFARCKNKKGRWVKSSLEFKGYGYPVSNCDGRLVDDWVCY